MYCKHCGTEIKEKGAYCINCGGEINSHVDDQSNNVMKITKQPNNFFHTLKTKFENGELTAKHLAITLLIAIGIFIFYINSNPEYTIKRYFDYTSRGFFDKALTLMNIPDNLKEDAEMEAEEMRSKYSRYNYKLKVLSTSTLSKGNDIAVVATTLSNGTEVATKNVVLLRINGKWKLDMQLTEEYSN